MQRVALTGNVASGKSTVADCWRELGAPIVDADVLAREAVQPGSVGLAEVAREFGQGVLAPDGSLDRAALRAVVFADAQLRRRLEAIVHPEVARLRARADEEFAAAGARVVVHDIPLLFEVGLDAGFPTIVFVDAPEAVRLDRIVRTRGVSREVASRISAAQLPAAFKRARAHHVIDNSGSLAELREKAEGVWREILRQIPSA